MLLALLLVLTMLRGLGIISGMKLNYPDELREFFRRKGKIGAAKRMRVLSPEQRREIARKAAQARWSTQKQNQSKKSRRNKPGKGGKGE